MNQIRSSEVLEVHDTAGELGRALCDRGDQADNLPVIKRTRTEAATQPDLFDIGQPEYAAAFACKAEATRQFCEPSLLLGTSSFTATGWPATFYH